MIVPFQLAGKNIADKSTKAIAASLEPVHA